MRSTPATRAGTAPRTVSVAARSRLDLRSGFAESRLGVKVIVRPLTAPSGTVTASSAVFVASQAANRLPVRLPEFTV